MLWKYPYGHFILVTFCHLWQISINFITQCLVQTKRLFHTQEFHITALRQLYYHPMDLCKSMDSICVFGWYRTDVISRYWLWQRFLTAHMVSIKLTTGLVLNHSIIHINQAGHKVYLFIKKERFCKIAVSIILKHIKLIITPSSYCIW